MDPVAFSIGPVEVRWYGLLMALSLLVGVFLAQREAKRRGMDPDKILDLVIIGAPLSWLGARLYYVIFNWDQYSQNPLEIFMIWHGGLAIHGGIITAILFGIWFARKHKLNFWLLGDVVAPSFVLGQAIGRWGNYFNQEAYGYETNLPWAMYIDGAYRHPTFLYESVWNLGVFFFLLWLRTKDISRKGIIFLSWLSFYSVGRFFVEGFRTDSLMLGPFRAAQIVSIIIFVVSIGVLFYRLKARESGK
ncbi:MAG: prolipoprotein diacylglyceryl transferase [Thermincolia bacterium]